MGLPMRPYCASMSRRICAVGIPAWYFFITSRVMSRQMFQVAAWLVNVTRSGVSAFT